MLLPWLVMNVIYCPVSVIELFIDILIILFDGKIDLEYLTILWLCGLYNGLLGMSKKYDLKIDIFMPIDS